MTCRATRRERVLVSRGRPSAITAQTLATYFGGGLEVDEIPLVADGDAAGTTDLAALERLLAERRAGRRGGRRRSRTSSASSSRWPRSAGWPTPPARCSWRVIEPVSLAVLAPPGAYGADIAAGRGPAARASPPQYGGPYLGILASTDAPRPPDPGPARRDDDRPRRPARPSS